jgi:hypothetical protein
MNTTITRTRDSVALKPTAVDPLTDSTRCHIADARNFASGECFFFRAECVLCHVILPAP